MYPTAVQTKTLECDERLLEGLKPVWSMLSGRDRCWSNCVKGHVRAQVYHYTCVTAMTLLHRTNPKGAVTIAVKKQSFCMLTRVSCCHVLSDMPDKRATNHLSPLGCHCLGCCVRRSLQCDAAEISVAPQWGPHLSTGQIALHLRPLCMHWPVLSAAVMATGSRDFLLHMYAIVVL